jgi:excisionase family DNA binding protein
MDSMGNEELPLVMTISQVAAYLGLHELTVRRLAREGEIPALKLGRQWRVKQDLLDRWIEERSMDNLGEIGKQQLALSSDP